MMQEVVLFVQVLNYFMVDYIQGQLNEMTDPDPGFAATRIWILSPGFAAAKKIELHGMAVHRFAFV